MHRNIKWSYLLGSKVKKIKKGLDFVGLEVDVRKEEKVGEHFHPSVEEELLRKFCRHVDVGYVMSCAMFSVDVSMNTYSVRGKKLGLLI